MMGWRISGFVVAAMALGAGAAMGGDTLGGIVLEMGGKDIAAVSGSLGECVTLCQTTLEAQKGAKLETQAENYPFYNPPSSYKMSFYAPKNSLSGVGTSWTWSVTFTVDADICLLGTQVALFSFDTSSVNAASCEASHPVRYAMELTGTGGGGASAGGSVVLQGASGATEAVSDLATGGITSGSGAVVTADWAAPVLLQQGGTYTYSLTMESMDHSASRSFGVGFGAVRFIPWEEVSRSSASGTPEPSTVLLSMLGLSLLSLRRRRAGGCHCPRNTFP